MPSRRDFLATTGIALGGTAAASVARSIAPHSSSSSDQVTFPVRFSLNTSTLRGQNLSIEHQVDIAAEAGYDGIEPWMGDIGKFIERGGSLDRLGERIAKANLEVVSAIGFAKWISNDDSTRQAGLKQARHDMELIKAIGGNRIAAPPVGVSRKGNNLPTLQQAALRYRELLEIGETVGVVPQLELWGHSPTISKLAELAYVSTAAEHRNACVLPDFYHIYKGGNDFSGLAMIEASKIHCFHINDYPANPPLQKIGDRDRVFPGDGVCPLPEIIRTLIANGFRGSFSLELFNPNYWKQDALKVAIEGLEKSKAVVHDALKEMKSDSSE